MRFLLAWIVVLVFGFVAPVSCSNALSRELDSNLRLTLSLVDSRYCSPEVLTLTLKLQFENVGNQPLILYKNSSVMGRYTVSKDTVAARQKRFELRVSPTKTLTNSGLRAEVPNEEDFVVLQPNESHSLEKVVHLSISKLLPAPRDHVLQLTVGTWYYLPEFAEEFRERWKEKGVLWSDPVTSEPMSFKVEERPQIVMCSQ